jgi:hypothetical protein
VSAPPTPDARADALADARATVARLLRALRKYGQHLPTCALRRLDEHTCTCGLETALAEGDA